MRTLYNILNCDTVKKARAWLGDAGIAIDDVALRRPTLDDVFLALTGRAAEELPDEEDG